jgi:hypothetical protein
MSADPDAEDRLYAASRFRPTMPVVDGHRAMKSTRAEAGSEDRMRRVRDVVHGKTAIPYEEHGFARHREVVASTIDLAHLGRAG